MIVNSVKDKIFDTEAKHIAFPINVEGFVDSKMTYSIVNKVWPELYHTGKHELGDVITKISKGKTYHALVCHSTIRGWGEEQRSVIKECFDKIETDGETIATELMSTGLIATIQGADTEQILLGMQDSANNLELHSAFSMEELEEYFKKAQRRKPKVYENII